MNPRDDATDPVESFGHHDDTLADGPGSALPPPAARDWLCGQRFVHGLLRQLNSADAGAREQRVQAVLDAVVARPGGDLRRMLAVVAAAVLLLTAVWMLLPAGVRTPTAEAAVARAATLLQQDVDRRFLLTMLRPEAPAARQRAEFTMTTRPGMRFLVEGDGPLGRLRLGCDGEEIWLVPPRKGLPTFAVPLAQAQQVLAMAGDVLDLGYLDVQGIVQRLPQGSRLRTLGEERGPGGERLLRVEATDLPDEARRHLVRAELWCDQDSGMVTRIECEGRGPREQVVRSVFEYRGTVELDEQAYRRPNRK